MSESENTNPSGGSQGLDIGSFLVRQVSSMVSATADAVAAGGNGSIVLDIEAHYYHLLVKSCNIKAAMAESFLKESKSSLILNGGDSGPATAKRKPRKGAK